MPRLTRLVVVTVAAALTLTAVLPVAASASPSSGASSAAANGGGCYKVFEPPNSWITVCSNGGGSGGAPGSGGGSTTSKCTVTLLSASQVKYLKLGKPPKGEKWADISCPGRNPFGGVTLVDANGVPAVTPEELMQVAWGQLEVPDLRAATAPPRGRDGLTGLPEWFWIPNGYAPVTSTVRAGPVWAEVIATPFSMSFDPGGGLAGTTCPGPGTPYPAASTDCSYTYDQSSATQPGGTYSAAVTVNWKVTWIGSDGNGGVLNPDLPTAWQFFQRVAEGQALVSGQ